MLSRSARGSLSVAKRLFISYAWESEEYRLWVQRLAARFRHDGVDARLDRWHLRANDNISEFMSREVRQADWVLVLCSPAYQSKLRAAEEGHSVSGVGWETRLLTGRMLGGSENKALAALARGSWAESSPDFLAGQIYYDLSNESTFGGTYRELLQRITGTYQSAPPLGELPADLEAEPVQPLPDGLDSGAPAQGSPDNELLNPKTSVPASVILQKCLLPYRLIYTRVTAEGVLDWDLSPIAPYDDFFDPTDSARREPRVTMVLYFPETEYLKSAPLNKRFTAVTAICCLKPDQIATDLLKMTSVEGLSLDRPANATHPADRERLFTAMSAAIGGTFVVSVAVPAALLRAGRKRPEISYQALCSMFLDPLVELHRKLEMEEVHLRLMGVGSCTPKLVALARAVLKESYPKKRGSTVEVISDGESELAVIGKIARYLAWAVERLYNRDEKKWLAYFEHRP
jgi:hypothetical protein